MIYGCVGPGMLRPYLVISAYVDSAHGHCEPGRFGTMLVVLAKANDVCLTH